MSCLDARTHVYRHRPELHAERLLVDEFVDRGHRALDVGTGATGRSATMLLDAGAEVHSIEVNGDAIAEFAGTEQSDGIRLTVADMIALPFPHRTFDIVLIALHGSDYLLAPEARARAFSEAARVLRPGGRLIFNSFNPIGTALSPSGLGSAQFRRVRMRYLRRAGFLRRTLIDVNRLRLHQATPARVIREVEAAAPLRFTTITNQSGSSRHRRLVGLLAAAPYYVFVRCEDEVTRPAAP